MQSRKLREILGNPGYTISNQEEYISVGSSLCHDLISVDKKTLKIKYALDTFGKGRKAIQNEKLEFIWDKLHELVTNGKIKEIIEKDDVIKNPLPVFTYSVNGIVETYTDEYGYPNVTISGEIMYANTYFKTKKEAAKAAIEEFSAGVELANRRIKDIETDLQKQKDWLRKDTESVNLFTELFNSL